MDARDFKESQLTNYRDLFLQRLGLSFMAEEVRFGAFRFDALARDKDGSIVVVEFKVAATKDALGQLLLYPHVIRNLIRDRGGGPTQVRSLLIATFVDRNVWEIAKTLNESFRLNIRILVCEGREPDDLRLVEPENASPDQVWDQSEARPWKPRHLDFRNGDLVIAP